MGSWSSDFRRAEAAQRRSERDAKKRQRELERRLKEQAKLSAAEQARLEVEAYENQLDVLLSVHKEGNAAIDWRGLAYGLPPHEPLRIARHELLALAQRINVEQGRELDGREYQLAREAYERELAEWNKIRSLACRVLNGEPRAYTEAVSSSSALTEISNLGSSIHMTVHDATLIECELKVNGRDVIPADAKSLTAGGKLTVKAMPKKRFHEIYHDYVCSCILRLAREMFALLPVDMVLVTAVVDGIDSRTGHDAELPVLSVVAIRAEVERLDFARLDPSDAVQAFQHRGDVMTSRTSGDFVPIIPLSPGDLIPTRPQSMDFTSLLNRVKQFRSELVGMLKPTTPEIGPMTNG